MSQVVEYDAAQLRRARRRRALITLAVVALMLFFAFWYAYSYYRADAGRPVTATPSCTTTTEPTPASVTVNVYNATSRNGLAAKTAAEVRKRGYRVATVANDPLQKTVDRTAEVRYGKRGVAGAKLVISLVKGAKGVPDARTDSSVDLVLGERFTSLAPVPKGKPKPTATSTPSRTGSC